MYLMHKYWARKPHNIVAEYVKRSTSPGDIVLDPFSGSGVTVLEAIRAGRKAIGFDLNPLATFIAECTALPANREKLLAAFKSLKERVARNINESLYSLRCSHCRREATISHIVWSRRAQCPRCSRTFTLAALKKRGQKYLCTNCREWFKEAFPGLSKGTKREDVTEIWFDCTNCGMRQRHQKPDAVLKEMLEGFEKRPYPRRFPDPPLWENPRILIRPGMRYSEFFTVRAAKALLLLHKAICRTDDVSVRKILLFTLTSGLAQMSKLIAYRGGFKTGGSAWTVPGFWLPAHHVEINVWNAFEARFWKILRGKDETNRVFASLFRPAYNFDDLDRATIWLRTHDSTDLSLVPTDSIDYIFTDPPYGDSVPYFEYCAFWAPWIGASLAYEREIVVSNSDKRGKSIENYRELLTMVFGECYRVLKPGAPMTLTFHNRDISVWKALVDAVLESGFSYIDDVYQVPAVVSSKAQLADKGSMTGDLIINFRKTPANSHSDLAKRSDANEIESLVIEEARRIIYERGGRATTEELYRGIIHCLIRHEVVGLFDEGIDKLLRRNFQERARNQWTYGSMGPPLEGLYELLDHSIERIVKSILSRGPMDETEVFAAVLTYLGNGRTPSRDRVLRILRRLAKKEGDQWQPNDERQVKLFEAHA